MVDAERLVAEQSLDEGYGEHSPLDRLVAEDGAVLLLGAPLDTVTLLHYAECIAAAGPKRWVEYAMPVLFDGVPTWRRIGELDSSLGAFPYEDLQLGEDAFAAMTRSAIAARVGQSGRVGCAKSHLLPARELVPTRSPGLKDISRADGLAPRTDLRAEPKRPCRGGIRRDFSSQYDQSMTPRKQRLTVTVDPELVAAGTRAVAEGAADSLSAWVSTALAEKARRDEQLGRLRDAITAYEAEFGGITEDEIAALQRSDREDAVVVRGRTRRRARPAKAKSA